MYNVGLVQNCREHKYRGMKIYGRKFKVGKKGNNAEASVEIRGSSNLIRNFSSEPHKRAGISCKTS